MDSTWEEQGARAERQRRRQVLALVLVIVVVAGVWSFPRSRGDEQQLGTTPGFEGGDRTLDTSPFEQAKPASTALTTIPDDELRPGSSTTTSTSTTLPPTTTTSTTRPIPQAPAGDPICGSATVILQALRIVTGPNGSTPDYLRLAALRFDEAGDILQATGRTDLGELLALIRKVADELPSAKDDSQAAAVFNQLLAPSDPALRPVSKEFTDHLAATCPEVLSIEP